MTKHNSCGNIKLESGDFMNMNEKGFTLVELLAVIVVLSVVSSLATYTIIKVVNNQKGHISDTKIEYLEKSAVMYLQDKPEVFKIATHCDVADTAKAKISNEYSSSEKNCIVIDVNDLIDAGYANKKSIEDVLLNEKIVVYRNNNRVYAVVRDYVSETDDIESIIVYLGDVNGDGAITQEDWDFVDQIIKGNITPTEAQKKVADISGDGDVNSTDRTYLEEIIQGTREKNIITLDNSVEGIVYYKNAGVTGNS
jgi:prepilin-type N-terminal cleavage/methylation domain-containing protein